MKDKQSNVKDKTSNAPQKGIKDRVLDLEKVILGMSEAYAKLIMNYNTLLKRLDQSAINDDNFKQKVSITTESMAAIVRLIRDGTEFTEANMSLAVSLNQEDRLIQQTQEMIEYGVLKEAESIAEKDSYIVGTEEDEKGKLITRRSQFPLSKLTTEFQEQFIGKKVGETIKLKEGNVIKITRIYDIVEPEEKKTPSKQEDLLPAKEQVDKLNKALEAGTEALNTETKAPLSDEEFLESLEDEPVNEQLTQGDNKEEKQSNIEEASEKASV